MHIFLSAWIHKYDVMSEVNSCAYRKALRSQRKEPLMDAKKVAVAFYYVGCKRAQLGQRIDLRVGKMRIFSFAGVSAAKEKAVDFAVFAP